MLRKSLKIFAYLIFLLLVVAFAVEGLARFIPGWNQWVNLIGNPDHRIPPNSTPDINSDGIRSRREASDFTEANFNILFLGDSFTYGLWLGDKETIPAQFEKIAAQTFPNKNIKTANFGWVSSSPFLSLRLLKDIGEKYKPDLIIQLVDMTDIGDDIYYQAIVNGEGIYDFGKYFPTLTLLLQKSIREHTQWDGLSQKLFVIPRQRYFIVEQPLAETRWGFEKLKQNIDATASYAREHLNANYMLFVMPRYFQYRPEESPQDWEALAGEYSVPGPYSQEPFRYFAEMALQVDYPVVSLLPDFKNLSVAPTVFPNDAHLNSDGARFAAERVFEHCLALGCLPIDTDKDEALDE